MIAINVLSIDLGQILPIIGDMHYPAEKSDLVEEAESRGATKEILDALQEISDKTYQNVDEVKNALQELTMSQKSGGEESQQGSEESGTQSKPEDGQKE